MATILTFPAVHCRRPSLYAVVRRTVMYGYNDGFLRGLVEILEKQGYENLALAIARAASDKQRNQHNHKELEELVDLAKRLLVETDAASNQ